MADRPTPMCGHCGERPADAGNQCQECLHRKVVTLNLIDLLEAVEGLPNNPAEAGRLIDPAEVHYVARMDVSAEALRDASAYLGAYANVLPANESGGRRRGRRRRSEPRLVDNVRGIVGGTLAPVAQSAPYFDHAFVHHEPVTPERLRRAATYLAAMADAYEAGPMERAWAEYRSRLPRNPG